MQDRLSWGFVCRSDQATWILDTKQIRSSLPVSSYKTLTKTRAGNVSNIQGQSSSLLDLVNKFWLWICTNAMHLHTVFETVEQTIILEESKDRFCTQALST